MESWRNMLPAAELVTSGAAGMAAERAAEVRRMGAAVGQEPLPEVERIRRQVSAPCA